MGRGQERRRIILKQGLDLASEVGLEAVTFGVLASRVGMSKSGLYAHFDTKEDLQMAVLDAAAQDFIDAVLAPALKEPRGLPRVRAIFERWLGWPGDRLPGGCPFIAATTELDDRPGPVRDRLVAHLRDLLGALERAASIAIEEGHFHADADVQQFAFEIWANLVGAHHYHRLLDSGDARDRARRTFTALLERVAA